MLTVVLLVIVAFASSASACQTCPSEATAGGCESGLASGYDVCYGGYGQTCYMEGSCGSGGGDGGPGKIRYRTSLPGRSCLICIGDKPGQGFELRIAAPTESEAPAPAQRNLAPRE
jgi:hypothetical protein